MSLLTWIIDKARRMTNKRVAELERRRRLERKIMLKHWVFSVKQSPDLHGTYCAWLLNTQNQPYGKRTGQFYYKEGVETPVWNSREELLFNEELIEELLEKLSDYPDSILIKVSK